MNSNLKALLLIGGIIVVFGFLGFLGFQVNTGEPAPAAPDGREIKVIFRGATMDDLPLRFTPQHNIQYSTPGVNLRNTFILENLSNEPVRFRPIHSVAPADAAAKYTMAVCFCFEDQEIPAGAKMEFPLVYRFGAELSDTVTVSHINYNLHSIPEGDDMRQASAEEAVR